MQRNCLSTLLCASAFLIANLLAVTVAPAQTQTVLYSFTDSSDGRNPDYVGRLVRDRAGNLFGVTEFGGDGVGCGSVGCGTIFELTPNPDGSWTETGLYTFQSNGDGAFPTGGMILDANGNLFGTTNEVDIFGCGTVFKLSGTVLTTLHNFNCNSDGSGPYTGVVRDQAGNLFGTTYAGGISNKGVVFEVSVSGTFTVIYNFCPTAGCFDGASPYGGLVIDQNGDLLGTTGNGGGELCNCGTVFKLSKSASGWKETVLHSFDGTDGALPQYASLTLGTLVNGTKKQTVIFGVTPGGGAKGLGTVFQLSKLSSGYKFTVLHSFSNDGGDAYSPYGTLLNFHGTLLGSTTGGGSGGRGTLFALQHIGDSWKEKVLYSFCPSGLPCNDGDGAPSGIISDASGNLYGTTPNGGTASQGVVYRLTP